MCEWRFFSIQNPWHFTWIPLNNAFHEDKVNLRWLTRTPHRFGILEVMYWLRMWKIWNCEGVELWNCLPQKHFVFCKFCERQRKIHTITQWYNCEKMFYQSIALIIYSGHSNNLIMVVSPNKTVRFLVKSNMHINSYLKFKKFTVRFLRWFCGVVSPSLLEDVEPAPKKKKKCAHLHPPVRIVLKVSGKVNPSVPHKNKTNKVPRSGNHSFSVCVMINWAVWRTRPGYVIQKTFNCCACQWDLLPNLPEGMFLKLRALKRGVLQKSRPFVNKIVIE